MDSFEDVPLNPMQSSLLESASLMHELNTRQIKMLQEKIFDNEREVKGYQKEVYALEQETKQLQSQLNHAMSLNQNYEKAVNQVVAAYNITPPYQITFIYDKGKPIGVRLPKKLNDVVNSATSNNPVT